MIIERLKEGRLDSRNCCRTADWISVDDQGPGESVTKGTVWRLNIQKMPKDLSQPGKQLAYCVVCAGDPKEALCVCGWPEFNSSDEVGKGLKMTGTILVGIFSLLW